MEAAVMENTGFSEEPLPIAQEKNSRKDLPATLRANRST
jgi:hypothetical protein